MPRHQGPLRKPISVRLSEAAQADVAALQDYWGINRTAVSERARAQAKLYADAHPKRFMPGSATRKMHSGRSGPLG